MDADLLREIVADEIRCVIKYYYREFMFGLFMVILIGFAIWLTLKSNGDTSFSYCPAAGEMISSRELSKEDMDKVMYVYEKVKDIQTAEKEKEKQKEYTLEKVGEAQREDLDAYLARHSSCSDALVEEKVERILTKRAKVKEAEEV